MIDLAYMKEIAAGESLELSGDVLQKLDRYAELLSEWNEKINLTAIIEPKDIAVKHFLDSLLLLKAVPLPEGASLIDVGTGAGFPSVPCGLYRPDLKLTLLDSLNKRVVFLSELTKALSLPAECVHARAEEAGRESGRREMYDCASARAVAHLRELSEYCLPFVKVGGVFAALKGPDAEQELEESKPAIRLLGGKVEDVKQYSLPDGSRRAIIVIKKISQTSTKYPRPSAKMKKQPLK